MKIEPFLMFEGRAEEAMRYYISLFDRSEVIDAQRYGPGEAGPEGSIVHAAFSLNGQVFHCSDSYIHHGFTFTPSVSFYVTCATEAEIDRVFAAFAADGAVLMPLGEYPFSRRFGWVQDKFGVSWQLTLSSN